MRLISAQTARGMQHSRRYIPTGSRLQFECLGIVGDLIVTLIEIHQAFLNLLFGGAGCDAKKGIGEIPAMVIELWREIIRFGFSLLTSHGSIFIIVVDVMGKRSHIVKKFGVHGPAFVLFPNTGTDDFTAKFLDGIFEQKLLFFFTILKNHRTQTFIFSGKRSILGRGRGRKPSFINAASCPT